MVTLLLEEGLLPLGVGLLLLAVLLRQMLLIILCVLVRRVVVTRGIGLREPGSGQAEGRSEQEEADASRFHGLTCEVGLAESYTLTASSSHQKVEIPLASPQFYPTHAR